VSAPPHHQYGAQERAAEQGIPSKCEKILSKQGLRLLYSYAAKTNNTIVKPKTIINGGEGGGKLPILNSCP